MHRPQNLGGVLKRCILGGFWVSWDSDGLHDMYFDQRGVLTQVAAPPAVFLHSSQQILTLFAGLLPCINHKNWEVFVGVHFWGNPGELEFR
jgi:hypothetical protein